MQHLLAGKEKRRQSLGYLRVLGLKQWRSGERVLTLGQYNIEGFTGNYVQAI